jgi:drug/metabolite transporter (DMT)-like permease
LSAKHPKPVLLVVLIGVMVASWPFNLILGKVALRYFPVLAVASFRLVMAGLIMLPIYWVRRSQDKSAGIWEHFCYLQFWE